ncbi:hypothetical protein VFPBJ_11383 [Purpureocillium lilacinum]|uniref:Uncharacterized protein n=1 Tax=Purpureocillium lilacinum TaxID=33203 RepID=A0A179FBC1_PURLI|nr:hypothetical protein VFPBJ_11383 [Purpureocillium lilacinum]
MLSTAGHFTFGCETLGVWTMETSCLGHSLAASLAVIAEHGTFCHDYTCGIRWPRPTPGRQRHSGGGSKCSDTGFPDCFPLPMVGDRHRFS